MTETWHGVWPCVKCFTFQSIEDLNLWMDGWMDVHFGSWALTISKDCSVTSYPATKFLGQCFGQSDSRKKSPPRLQILSWSKHYNIVCCAMGSGDIYFRSMLCEGDKSKYKYRRIISGTEAMFRGLYVLSSSPKIWHLIDEKCRISLRQSHL